MCKGSGCCVTDRKENTCRLAIADGRQLTVTEDGLLTLAKKGTRFTLHWHGHNCYALTDPDGRYLEYGREKRKTPLFFERRALIPRNLFDFVNVGEK